MSPIELQITTHEGMVHTVPAPAGKTVMWAAVQAGLEGIVAECGGTLTCATCHVYVQAEWVERLPPPTIDEAAMLELTAAPRETTSRLSCQLVVTPELHGLALKLPPTQY